MQKKNTSFSWLTILSQLCFLFIVTTASAVPARSGLITVQQSDGTTLRIRIHGDEFYHYTVSEEGYTLIAGPKGDYYFAKLTADGQLESTGIQARPMNQLSTAERQRLSTNVQKGIRPVLTSRQQSMRQSMRQKQTNHPLTRTLNGLPEPPQGIGSADFLTTGEGKGLVLLAEFPDLPFTVGQKSDFEELLNSRNYTRDGATGSAWQYYYENSNGRFDPEFTVVGPYTLPHARSYYTTNDYGKFDSMDAAWKMIIDVCQLAYENGVDFTPYAENGKLRDVFVFYAGGNSSDGSDATAIWPHRWDISWTGETVGGLQLAGYACSSELEKKANDEINFAAIGTFCHEFGHVLGWPDLYDTDGDTNGYAPGPNYFSLMALGCYNNDSRTPPALSLLERWMVGWAEPELIGSEANYRMEPVSLDHGYLMESGTQDEYFLMEYRGAGFTVWDNPAYYSEYERVAYSGMVVYHVDYTTPRMWYYSNTLNANASHECYRLVCSAPNQKDAEWYSSFTLFPGGNNITSLTPAENTRFMTWSNSYPPFNLTDITLVKGECVTFNTISNGLHNCNILPFQREALVKWDDNLSPSWTINWKETGGTATTAPHSITQRSFLLTGLTPGKNYEVTISNSQGETRTFTFDTQAEQVDGLPRIGLYRDTDEGNAIIYLSDADNGTIQNVKTSIDGTLITSTYLALSTGTHTIRVEITRTDDTVEYLLKEVTIGE